MRILALCHEYPPVGGGAAAICEALSEEYVRKGHQVDLVTMAFGDLPSQEIRDGVSIHRVQCMRKTKVMASPLEALSWARNAWKYVNRLQLNHSYDVTHAHFIMPAGILARKLKSKHGVPYVVTPHGSDVPGYNRERLKLAHHLAKPWWRKIISDSNLLTISSASLLSMLHTAIRPPADQVIPNGIDPNRFDPHHKERSIIMCSRLVERKGFHIALQAMQDMDLKDWEVHLVGDGPMRSRLEALAQTCKHPINMHGWIDNGDPKLAELYSKSAINIMLSEWENFPIALMEGLGAGCAIITTNVSGNPEVVGDAAIQIPPNDIEATKEAIQGLVNDWDSCIELGKKARHRAETVLTWENAAMQYLDIFKELTT